MYFGRVDFYTHTHMAHMRWAQTTVSAVIITSRNNHTMYTQCVYAYYYCYNDVTIFCAAAVRGGAVGATGGMEGWPVCRGAVCDANDGRSEREGLWERRRGVWWMSEEGHTTMLFRRNWIIRRAACKQWAMRQRRTLLPTVMARLEVGARGSRPRRRRTPPATHRRRLDTANNGRPSPLLPDDGPLDPFDAAECATPPVHVVGRRGTGARCSPQTQSLSVRYARAAATAVVARTHTVTRRKRVAWREIPARLMQFNDCCVACARPTRRGAAECAGPCD